MTLLGVDFNMGSSEPSTMNMSLDEMIASRQRSSSRISSRRRGGGQVGGDHDPNRVSNVDRSMATSRAKRDALLRARRGLSTNKKASEMEIEAEVQKQGKQTLLARAKKALQAKRSDSRLNATERAEIRQERRKLARAAAKVKREELAAKRGVAKSAPMKGPLGLVAETAPLGRPPSKKAVKAAMNAMEEKGFKIPNGYQMVISFAPSDTAAIVDAPRTNNSNNNNTNNKRNANSKPAAKNNPPRRGGRT